MESSKGYVGINNDSNGGITDTGKIIRDAWVFGIIPEDESCEGWLAAGFDGLRQKAHQEWEKYGFLVSNFPEELRERFMRIHDEAVTRAKEVGWRDDKEFTRGS